jgi:hypothetical protein
MSWFARVSARAKSPSDEGKLPHAGGKGEAFPMHWSFHDIANAPA